jgi:tryptophan synthase alpha chain
MLPRDQVAAAIRDADGPAIVAFITAGYPSKDTFLETLKAIAASADAIELGVPFSDPMADGVTIQRSSREAIAAGVTLHWILDTLSQRDFELEAPVLLMSYLNPLLAFGYEKLAQACVRASVSGFIVPDLPFEESEPLRRALDAEGLALVQLVTPATPAHRLETICAASQGFVYAVTRTGITGGASELPAELTEYLGRVKRASSLPVCAGFGVRNQAQVATIAAHADGVIVGSALVEVLERGEDPAAFIGGLRPAG